MTNQLPIVGKSMMPMGYHYAHFGADSNRAVQEGNYAVNSAQ